ncbi:MAG: Hsp70 family protein [Pseudonocardiales bacterium]
MANWSLGVDLGTSFSAAAIATAGRVELLDIGGERRIPSTVLLDEAGQLLAGTLAQRMVGRSPDRAERNPKRYVGRGPMLLGGHPVTVQNALAALLEVFLAEARRCFDGTEPDCVTLTHPVAWSPEQCQVLSGAAGLALPSSHIELLAEPVAAAVHYADEHRLGGGDSVAVYDLGGGTFDTAVLAADHEGFTVIGQPGGDPEIGGESFDERVYAHFGAQLERLAPQWWEQLSSNVDRRWLSAGAALLTEARRAKESLSDYDSASQYVQDADVDVHISRAELDELIGNDIRRTTQLLSETITASGRAPGDLRGIFLTGGASRTPLVQQNLRAAYGGLVRTWQDPKTVVALGAARWAQRGLGTPSRPPSSAALAAPTLGSPAAPTLGGPAAPTPGGLAAPLNVPRLAAPVSPFPVLADGVLHAYATADSCYLWCVTGPASAPQHRIRRIDARTGQVDRELAMGQIVGWAVSNELVLVAERRDATVRVHALSPALIIRSTTELPTERAPLLVVDGETGWVFVRSRDTHEVDNTTGLPWGETGDLSVLVIRLSTTFAPANLRTEPIGAAVFWYVNEDGAQRRLLDLSGPTGTLPTALGDGSCAIVLGRYTQKWSFRRPGQVIPRQLIMSIGPDQKTTVIAEQQARHHGAPWTHQVLRPTASSPWFLGTNIGLETFGDLSEGADRRLFIARPQAGAVRWVECGGHVYGVVMDQVVPNRGLSLHVLTESRRRDLGQWPGLLGNLASVWHTEAPRIRVDGDQLWVGVNSGEGGSTVLRVGPEAAEPVASAPGWLEPVGRADGALHALHAPSQPPGDSRTGPALLVRLPV